MKAGYIFLFLISMNCISNVAAQTIAEKSKSSPEFDRGWFSFGLGKSYLSFKQIDKGKNLSASINSFWGKKHIVQVSLNISEAPILGDDVKSKSIFIGYGRTEAFPLFRYYAGIGPEFYRFNYNDLQIKVPLPIGLTGHFHFSLTPIREFGLSAEYRFSLVSTGYISSITFCFMIDGHK